MVAPGALVALVYLGLFSPYARLRAELVERGVDEEMAVTTEVPAHAE